MDIHKSEEKLQRKIKSIKNSEEISKENKDAILDFERYCYTVQRLSASRVLNYMVHLSKLAKILNKNFVDCNKNDVISLVEKVERDGYIDKEDVRKEYSPNSKVILRVCIKKFFRWLRNVEWPDCPEEVKWLSSSIKQNEKKFIISILFPIL